MKAYEAALAMYQREHDRWYQWALFFFAGIGAAFYIAGEYRLRLWVPATTSALICLLWVLVASSIRASTRAWQSTLHHLESFPEPTKGAFKTFERCLRSFPYGRDFLNTLHLHRKRRFLSVTRLLVWTGLLGLLAFSILAALDATCHIEPNRCTATFTRGST